MENFGKANVFHEFIEFPRFLAGLTKFAAKPSIHGKHWPEEFMENIGKANVFHELKEFPRFLAGLTQFSGKP